MTPSVKSLLYQEKITLRYQNLDPCSATADTICFAFTKIGFSIVPAIPIEFFPWKAMAILLSTFS
jgi:hypothetical protein